MTHPTSPGELPAPPASTSGRTTWSRTACDGTPYLQALNNHAPAEIRDAVTGGVLLWSVPWRGAGSAYFELYDTTAGPVLKTDICFGWAYAWGWPDHAAVVRHVRRHTAELDLAEGYPRRHGVILAGGPWGTVISQRGHVRAILHTEHGPETRWYPDPRQALDAAAAHSRDASAWADQLQAATPRARDTERHDAIRAATPPPGPGPRPAQVRNLIRIIRQVCHRSYVTPAGGAGR